jgi:hypothetical protein
MKIGACSGHCFSIGAIPGRLGDIVLINMPYYLNLLNENQGKHGGVQPFILPDEVFTGVDRFHLSIGWQSSGKKQNVLV